LTRVGRSLGARHGLLTLALLLAAVSTASPQRLEGLVNIRFQLDARVFAVMAALNAAGFDRGAERLAPDSVRVRVRERLTRLDPDLKERLKGFRAVRRTERDDDGDVSAYVSLALLVGAPPRFELSIPAEQLPTDAQGIAGFERLTAEVWRAAGLDELWEKLHPAYAAEVEAFRPDIRGLILETLRYMKTEARVSLDRQVNFIPDLLGPAGVVNARNVADNYFVVVGPASAERRPLRSIRHEYLHFMIDPLIVKYAGRLPEPEPFLESVRRRGKVEARYAQDFPLVVTESLIRVLELRLDRSQEREKLAAAFEEGLILAPFFDEELTRFESGALSLQEAFPDVVSRIRWDAEKRRAEAIARPAEKTPAVPLPAVSAEARRRLVRANELLAAGEFEAARVLLEEALAADPASASALFGLAQIAARAQDLARALDLYRRAADAAGPERWIAAWSYVRRGNILEFQGDHVGAQAEWKRVAGLDGDLRGAREAAERALSGGR
jgi:hypothetical protein